MGNHIDHIEITNFKSIRHLNIEGCKRINVFIGYPNVGKSNILEALGLYSTLLLGSEAQFSFDDICRADEPLDIFHNNDSKKGSRIILNSEAELNIVHAAPLLLNLKYNNIKYAEANEAKEKFNKLEEMTVVFPDKPDAFIGSKIAITPKYETNTTKVFPWAIKKYEFKKNYVGSGWRDTFPLGMPNGHNLIDVLRHEVDLTKEINEIFIEYGLKILFDINRDKIFLLKELANGAAMTIPYNLIADTLQRLIFHKAAIRSNSNAVLLFEEPEAHMFPPYIGKFTGEIIYEKDNGNQYFISTHSPFVMNDFLEDARDELSVYLVGYKNGETTIKRLSDEELHRVYQYGVDLFFNIESYLD
jgi:hypothetical protein